MRTLREVLAKIAAWFRATDDDLELAPYLVGALVCTAIELPILHCGGCSKEEIVFCMGFSFSGALGLSMLMELYLHWKD